MGKISGWLAVGALALSTSLVSAAPDPPKDDGKGAEARFAKLDTNKDEKLSKEEFCAGKEGAAKERAEKMFAKKDANKDGSLDLEEFKAKPKKDDE